MTVVQKGPKNSEDKPSNRFEELPSFGWNGGRKDGGVGKQCQKLRYLQSRKQISKSIRKSRHVLQRDRKIQIHREKKITITQVANVVPNSEQQSRFKLYSSRASTISTSQEVLKMPLKRYGLQSCSPKDYVLFDVVGRFSNADTSTPNKKKEVRKTNRKIQKRIKRNQNGSLNMYVL